MAALSTMLASKTRVRLLADVERRTQFFEHVVSPTCVALAPLLLASSVSALSVRQD